MSGTEPWMLYGAAGHTGALIAQHASESGHRPLLAGRSAPTITALAGRLACPHPEPFRHRPSPGDQRPRDVAPAWANVTCYGISLAAAGPRSAVPARGAARRGRRSR